MKFGEALELCREGKRIYRTGWNGSNQFVYYQKGNTVITEALYCNAIREWALREGLATIYIMGHFNIKTTAGVIQCGWLASQGDMQAEDWQVLND